MPIYRPDVQIITLLLLVCCCSTMATVRVHMLTWNVGGTVPRDDITPLLGLDKDPDIISTGFEEVGDTDKWEDEVDKILSKRGYYRIQLKTMTIMQIVVFAKKSILPYISHIESEATKTGFGGAYGNKGGTTVRFRLFDKTMAILNTHLSAHMDQTHIRDEEYWAIMAEQEFRDSKSHALYDHDYILWGGDLNYRIEYDNIKVRSTLGTGKYLDLLQYDQLLQEQSAGHAFIGFHEADIHFPPTYKFDPDTDIYDTSEKNRVPAWCDRVLWRIKAERQEITKALQWGSDDSSLESDLSLSLSDMSDTAEPDGACASVPAKKKRLRKKKPKKDTCEDEESDGDKTRLETLRRRTSALMRKTAQYASETGVSIVNKATGLGGQVQIHKADIVDPDRFKSFLSTLEREKVAAVKSKYEGSVKCLNYDHRADFKQSDHKPVFALLEVAVDKSLSAGIKFTADIFMWKKGESLTTTYTVSKNVEVGAWDWVCLCESDWTDANKHYIVYEYVALGKGKVKFPAMSHPGKAKTLQVVYVSSKMTAPVAVTNVTCQM